MKDSDFSKVALCALGVVVILAVVISVTTGTSDETRSAKTAPLSTSLNDGFESLIRGLRMQAPMLQDAVYMDYTGAGVYVQEQVNAGAELLKSGRLCNTHSDSTCALETSMAIDEAREDVRRYFNASAHDVVFTANASAAIASFVHSLDLRPGDYYIYGRNAHNSIVGQRQELVERGVNVLLFDERAPRDCDAFHLVSGSVEAGKRVLLALTLESNFSGYKMTADDIRQARRTVETCFATDDILILGDAAALASHSTVDLNALPVDAIVLSFYKMFGMPTGIGALLIREDLKPLLVQRQFGGGTVVLAGSETPFFKGRATIHELLELGTLNYQSIPMIPIGLDVLRSVGLGCDSQSPYRGQLEGRLERLGAELRDRLSRLETKKEIRLVDSGTGPIISFRVFDNGVALCPSMIVGKLAANGINARGGCHCNPGECYSTSDIDETDLPVLAEAMETCSTNVEGVKVGTVRLSLGYLSTDEDIDILVTTMASLLG